LNALNFEELWESLVWSWDLDKHMYNNYALSSLQLGAASSNSYQFFIFLWNSL